MKESIVDLRILMNRTFALGTIQIAILSFPSRDLGRIRKLALPARHAFGLPMADGRSIAGRWQAGTSPPAIA